VLDRNFEAEAPNCKWIADLTDVWSAEGWLYVAGVIDLFSRRAEGRSMQAVREIAKNSSWASVANCANIAAMFVAISISRLLIVASKKATQPMWHVARRRPSVHRLGRSRVHHCKTRAFFNVTAPQRADVLG
jgi:hypothetical protein